MVLVEVPSKMRIIDPTKVYLVTGAAGFIGFHVTKALLEQKATVVGVDNLNDYYDVSLKQARLNQLVPYKTFTFIKLDIASHHELNAVFEQYHPSIVIHLAAQAGVRYSMENPSAYIQSNIVGHFNILEACRHYPVEHLLYASSSSVYGANQKVPFEETDSVDHPVSLYAATKKADELITDTYSHLYHIPATGLRFFTVYGPWGRPDMAYFDFTNKYFKGEPIKVFNGGREQDLMRDFTYIDDIVEGIIQLIPHKPSGKPSHQIMNIGNNTPVKLNEFIRILETCLSKELHKPVEFSKIVEQMKPGDVPTTYASIDKLNSVTGFKPKTSLQKGLAQFVKWYVEYHAIT